MITSDQKRFEEIEDCLDIMSFSGDNFLDISKETWISETQRKLYSVFRNRKTGSIIFFLSVIPTMTGLMDARLLSLNGEIAEKTLREIGAVMMENTENGSQL
jgi:hypothetical protein